MSIQITEDKATHRNTCNEFFAPNMIGREISFDVQPYEHGKGKIVSISVREIEFKAHDVEYGSVWKKAEVYDVTVELESGSRTGALICGVPVRGTVANLAGKKTTVSGMSYRDLREAAVNGKTFIKATCG